MAVSLSVIAAKDSAGTAIAGGLQAQDKSGAGTGPFTLGQVLIDGVAGINMAAVTAANAVKVDGSAVTQPVSLTSTTITGTVAATQSGTWTVQPGNTANTTAWKVDGSAVTQPVSIATAPVLVAGSAVIGKIGIDQTTDLTTNKVRAFIHDGTTALPILAASSGAPAATVPAIPVSIRDVNPNGQAAMAGSAPVTLPSDSNGPYSATANFVSGAITTAMTGTTTTSLVAAPGASLRNYITTLVVSNSHATVGTDVIIQDGSGGATLMTIPAAALYGGGVISLPAPLKQPTTNTALFCANVTTGASTKVSAFGYKGA